MKNGIVILNYNDSENTSLILDDIKNFKILDYIIIVDNNSTDNSVKKLKKYENNKIKIVNKRFRAKRNRYGCTKCKRTKRSIKRMEITNIYIRIVIKHSILSFLSNKTFKL